jgi:hypothetical protein
MIMLFKSSFDLFLLPALLTTDSEFQRITTLQFEGITWQQLFKSHQFSENKLRLFQTAISNIKRILKNYKTALEVENFYYCWKDYQRIRYWIYTNEIT